MTALYDFIDQETQQDVPTGIRKLAETIYRDNKAVQAVILYGSGLWGKTPPQETVYDFYVIIDNYLKFDKRPLAALLGFIAPPNVYYKEIKAKSGTFRFKYATMTLGPFAREARGLTLSPLIWARFAQPCRIVYARDENIRSNIVQALSDAVVTFHKKTIPLFEEPFFTAEDIWTKGLAETYARELRSEKAGRGKTIYMAAPESFTQRTKLALPLTNLPLHEESGVFVNRIPPMERHKHQILAPFPRIGGKFFAFLNLLKAPLTFAGSVDYALWKVERQSGVRIEASDFQRRFPLIAGWPLLWEIYKKGGLR